MGHICNVSNVGTDVTDVTNGGCFCRRPCEVVNAFAQHFKDKVNKIIKECKVDNEVFNGNQKIFVQSYNFMAEENVYLSSNQLKLKTVRDMTGYRKGSLLML